MDDIKEYLKAERSQEWRTELRKSKKAKERTGLERASMPEADANKRNKNNEEVNKGLAAEIALVEASRCLDCANPTCIAGCPVGINIPKFIKRTIAATNIIPPRKKAANIISESYLYKAHHGDTIAKIANIIIIIF